MQPASGFYRNYGVIRPTEANGESFIPFMVLGLLKFQKDAARSEKLKREAAERISGTRGIDLGDVQNRKS